MDVRGITKEEPPHVVVYAEPRFVEEVQDIGFNSGLMMGWWVRLRPCGWGTEEEKGYKFSEVGDMELGTRWRRLGISCRKVFLQGE
jgi:hypothetical protein